ncbi:heme utilization cystosolic carrier protein HutX [Agarivorans sp. Alg241-V36]|jgi:putative heme utilization carrier protein HutX|uniref:heme utilization cystosolic carrier protein HutX n=1 Tax=Agarivorans sp. Alg241-V36 TaxID=2305992 RepID=UPI0013D43A6A|nr:heme utilization cystosolic carrier protein HutX [Agarivorans sp. Alg241-V36]
MALTPAEVVEQHSELSVAQLAEKAQCSEAEVVELLPQEWACWLPTEQLQWLMYDLPSWGPMTTIIQVAGSVFEIKDNFPSGKPGHGYYNLMDKQSHLHGHLKLDNIASVALISKPLRGTESYCFQFFDDNGSTVFKVYLGRDRKRVLLPQQVERFELLKQNMALTELENQQ